jgi:hypothetical protein
MGTRNSLFVTALLGITLLGGCSKSSPKGEPDPAPQPLLLLRLDSPSYLATGLASDSKIAITIIQMDPTRWATYEAAQKGVTQYAVIESYPAQKAVQGSWSANPAQSFVTFTPDSSLSDGDYVIRFPKASSDLVVKPRSYNFFHVGSLLRLAEVEILRDKSSGGTSTDLVRVVCGFSEAPSSKASLTITVAQAQGASWVDISSTVESQSTVKLAQAIDPQKTVRVTVTGSDLDGKWKGVAGSGPAVVEFLPADYTVEPGQIQYPVEPVLDIELPSGTKK